MSKRTLALALGIAVAGGLSFAGLVNGPGAFAQDGASPATAPEAQAPVSPEASAPAVPAPAQQAEDTAPEAQATSPVEGAPADSANEAAAPAAPADGNVEAPAATEAPAAATETDAAAPVESPASTADEKKDTSSAPAAAPAAAPVLAAQTDVEKAAGLTEKYHATSHDSLFSVSFSGAHGWAVGDHGLTLSTQDGGQTWVVGPKLTTSALLAVDMIDDQRAVIVGQSGAAFVTTDGGKVWQKAKTDFKGRLFAASINSQGFGLAVGEFGALMRTRDFGQSWEQVKTDWTNELGVEQDPHLYVVKVTEQGVATIAGEFGVIARSTDEGNKWGVHHKSDESVFGLQMQDNGTRGFAVGQEGLILATTDGGNSWQRMPSPTKTILLDVWSAPDGEAVAVGIHMILRSRDGGKTWVETQGGRFSESWFEGLAGGQASVEIQSGRDDTGAQVGSRLTMSQTKVYAVGQGAVILNIEE